MTLVEDLKENFIPYLLSVLVTIVMGLFLSIINNDLNWLYVVLLIPSTFILIFVLQVVVLLLITYKNERNI